jgi:hypothetical protein
MFGDERYVEGRGRAQEVGITIGIIYTSGEFRQALRSVLKFRFETK